jgi:DNA-binding XRE family transcriptional regulator
MGASCARLLPLSNTLLAPLGRIDYRRRHVHHARMEKLKAWFALTGLSQEQLASEIGVTRATIHNWLTGQNVPSGLSLRRLHEFTRIPLDDLVPRDVA